MPSRAVNPGRKESVMIEIVIVVEGGMVQEVYSTDKNVSVAVNDHDTEEGQQEAVELPDFRVC